MNDFTTALVRATRVNRGIAWRHLPVLAAGVGAVTAVAAGAITIGATRASAEAQRVVLDGGTKVSFLKYHQHIRNAKIWGDSDLVFSQNGDVEVRSRLRNDFILERTIVTSCRLEYTIPGHPVHGGTLPFLFGARYEGRATGTQSKRYNLPQVKAHFNFIKSEGYVECYIA